MQDAKVLNVAPSHNFVGLYLRNYRQLERNLLNSSVSFTCFDNMVNFGPLTNGWDRLASFAHPSKFQQVSRLGFVTAPTSLNEGQPKFARCLAVSFAGTLYIHFRGLLPRNGSLPGAKFTLRPSHAFSCIGSFTARHSSSERQPKFVALYTRNGM